MSEENPTRLEQVEKLCCEKGIAIMRLEAELQRYKDKENEVCEWPQVPTAWHCRTSCNKVALDSMGFTYCPYCHKRIKPV